MTSPSESKPNRIFIGTMRNGQVRCGIEFDEGTLTPQKFKIIKKAVSAYVRACEELKAIEEIELAEDERELFEMNRKTMEKLV